MTDAQKVEALSDLLSDVISALELTIYDIDDPHVRSEINTKADNFFQTMLNIKNSEAE